MVVLVGGAPLPPNTATQGAPGLRLFDGVLEIVGGVAVTRPWVILCAQEQQYSRNIQRSDHAM